MKQFLFYAILAVVTLAACNKDQSRQTIQQSETVMPSAGELIVSSPQKAASSSATALAAPTALGTLAEFTLSGSPVTANSTATITVKNAQLPGVTTVGNAVVGIVKLTFDNDATVTDNVAAKLKATTGAAVVQIVSTVPTTNALKNGELITSLATTATTITRANNSNELFLLFQSGANGFSIADTAIVEITAKGETFTVTVVGEGSAELAENQTKLNKIGIQGSGKIASIKSSDATKIDGPTALNSSAKEFTIAGSEGTASDLNIVVANAKAADFKAASSGKIGIVQLVLNNAKSLDITFSAKIKFGAEKGRVGLMQAEPTASTTSLLAENVLQNVLDAMGTNGDKTKWSDATESDANSSKKTHLLFQGGTTGFAATDEIIVEITATLGTGDDMATKIFTVGISVAKAATTGAGS